MMEGTQTEEQGLHEEKVTKSNYVIKEDDIEEIPCPWYKCLSLLNIFQFRSHCDQHRKYEYKLHDVLTYSNENQSYDDMFNKDKYDASENRSSNQLQRILLTMPKLSRRSFQDNTDLKTKKISNILVRFRSKSSQEYESESGTDSSVSIIKLVCDFCNYKTTKKADLKKHKICVHEWVKFRKLTLKFNCNECDFYTAKKSQLKLHKMSMHQEVQYQCDENDNKSRRHSHRPRHKRGSQVKFKRDEFSSRDIQDKLLKLSVDKGFKHKCDVCPYQTTNNSHFLRHIQSVHKGIKYKCDKCSSQFTRRRNLNVHFLGVHEGDTSKGLPLQGANQLCEKLFDGSFSCLSCGKVFSDQSNCKRHIKINHLGENKNTICPNCNKQVLKTYISSHMKKYCSSRPLYHDDEAGNSFSQY